jgi:PAS domain S-box-containing protein
VTTGGSNSDGAPTDPGGHHTSEGRNVVRGSQGRGGQDVFFAAVQMTRMPMCLSDPNQPDNPLVFVNRAFEELTGYAEEEVLGLNCRFLQGAETDRAVVAEVGRALAAKVDVAVELYNYRKNGTGFWNALYLSPVFDDAGHLLYFFASQIDVTKRRAAEAVVQQSQRMEALGSMAVGVAHEFNNLMTVVRGSLEQARSQPSSERQAEQLARADWAAQHVGRLTQQMLSFSHRQFHNLALADLGALARNMDILLKQVVGSRITLTVDAPPEPLPVLVDAGQLELALLNLVRNAADATADGGTLTIHACGLDLDGAAPMAVLEVADTGIGMSPDVVRRAAEPFFTTKKRGKGTGLGLSMVQGFAGQSGGRLEIDSTPGQGSRVRVVLPRKTDAAPACAG